MLLTPAGWGGATWLREKWRFIVMIVVLNTTFYNRHCSASQTPAMLLLLLLLLMREEKDAVYSACSTGNTHNY